MSTSENEDVEPRRKKGKVNTELHVREMEKIARRKGEEFVSSTGKLVEAKQTGPDCQCRKQCMSKLSDVDKKYILEKLYAGQSKNEQDTYLMGCIERLDVKRHRPTVEHSKQIDSTFKYYAIVSGNRSEVCRKAFISLHAISHKIVLRLTNLLASGKSPIDKRGKHFNRVNTIPLNITSKIHDHIDSYPKYVTHYTNKPITYLDDKLDVLKMYDMFVQKHPDLGNKVKYEFFFKYFKDNFGYRFGKPQVDVCSTCENLTTKLKCNTLNDNAKRTAAAELLVHKRRAKKFYTKLDEVKELSKTKPNVMGIVFDFMQNLPLPSLPVQEMFFLRKLWYYVFNVYDLKNDRVVFYTYPEGIANKGPDEVTSFVLDFIQNEIPAEITELHIFSDACGGQNRNHTMVRLLLALTMSGRFAEIHSYYPIRGHSFLPCDRTFAVIKRAVRKYDRIYSPDQYKTIIENAKKVEPTYKVKQVKNEDVLDCKNWWPRYFVKLPKSLEDRNISFSISKYRYLIYRSDPKGYVVASEFINGSVSHTFKLKKSNEVALPSSKAYNDGKVPIKAAKINDVMKLIKYIPEEYLPFYEERKTWPTTNAETLGDN